MKSPFIKSHFRPVFGIHLQNLYRYQWWAINALYHGIFSRFASFPCLLTPVSLLFRNCSILVDFVNDSRTVFVIAAQYQPKPASGVNRDFAYKNFHKMPADLQCLSLIHGRLVNFIFSLHRVHRSFILSPFFFRPTKHAFSMI